MKINDLIDHANRFYPDCMIQQNWDYVKSRPKNPRACADTLAVFVCLEIESTFNPEASDEDQLFEAARAIQTAVDELSSVVRGLKDISNKMAIA